MKLIEKMAIDWSDKIWAGSCYDDPPAGIAEDSFVAGFKAARDLFTRLLIEAKIGDFHPSDLQNIGEQEI